MPNIKMLFSVNGSKTISESTFLAALAKQGVRANDPRIQSVRGAFQPDASFSPLIDSGDLQRLADENSFLSKVLSGNTIIPDFETFCAELQQIFNAVKQNRDGTIAAYIPQLARVESDLFTVAVCTVDGQVFQTGDSGCYFCLQSTSKPVTYSITLEQLGVNKVHEHVGKEPSGRSFNELSLNHKGLPHNPLLNAGAIMTSSLIEPGKDMSDRFDLILKKWSELAGDSKVTFNNSVYLSERSTADRNFALAYFMRENRAFAEGANIHEALDLYFQSCSIEVSALQLATVAATYANSGINPFTNKKIFSATTVQNCLSMMNACGMYDYSGEWAFAVGVPAKSGVSGAIWLVVPGIMGICVYSPRLDAIGNSVRGVAFARELVQRFNFHNFDSVNHQNGNKKDPRRKRYETQANELMAFIFAAAHGDLDEVRRIHATGIDINQGDYDGRTALHLAASENRRPVVEYLLQHGGRVDLKDRWGGTPISDAKKAKHAGIIELLNNQIIQA